MATSKFPLPFSRVYINSTALNSVPPVTDYQIGLTLEIIGSSGAPDSTAGTLATFKITNIRAFQIFVARNVGTLYFRPSDGNTSGTPVWIGWRKLTGTVV